jgi:hypothetical protein
MKRLSDSSVQIAGDILNLSISTAICDIFACQIRAWPASATQAEAIRAEKRAVEILGVDFLRCISIVFVSGNNGRLTDSQFST